MKIGSVIIFCVMVIIEKQGGNPLRSPAKGAASAVQQRLLDLDVERCRAIGALLEGSCRYYQCLTGSASSVSL